MGSFVPTHPENASRVLLLKKWLYVVLCRLLGANAAFFALLHHFHSLRHTYASRLVQNGASVYKVQALLGHSDVGTTQQYAHLTGQSLRGDVERAFGESPSEEARLKAEVARLHEEVRGLRARLAAYEPAGLALAA